MQGLRRYRSQTGGKMNLTAVEQGHVNIQIEIKKGFPVLFIDFVELFSHVCSLVFCNHIGG